MAIEIYEGYFGSQIINSSTSVLRECEIGAYSAQLESFLQGFTPIVRYEWLTSCSWLLTEYTVSQPSVFEPNCGGPQIPTPLAYWRQFSLET
eukprot:1154827-Pelagomonas_calceolata.AAC.3